MARASGPFQCSVSCASGTCWRRSVWSGVATPLGSAFSSPPLFREDRTQLGLRTTCKSRRFCVGDQAEFVRTTAESGGDPFSMRLGLSGCVCARDTADSRAAGRRPAPVSRPVPARESRACTGRLTHGPARAGCRAARYGSRWVFFRPVQCVACFRAGTCAASSPVSRESGLI